MVLGGGGYALFDESANRIDGTHNTTRGTSGGAVEIGAGFDIRTPIKIPFPIGLRAEVRDLYTSKPNYNVSIGAGFQHMCFQEGWCCISEKPNAPPESSKKCFHGSGTEAPSGPHLRRTCWVIVDSTGKTIQIVTERVAVLR